MLIDNMDIKDEIMLILLTQIEMKTKNAIKRYLEKKE